MSRRFVLATMVALVAPAVVGGCGYRLAGPKGLYPENIRTIAVPVVGNRTFSRGESIQLTDALVRQIESRTPYRVAPAERADTLLEVMITDLRRGTTSRNRGTALPEEQLYVVVVDLIWKDLRTGETLLRLENFEQTAALYPTLGESDFIASQSAAEDLAEGIVEELAGDW